MASVIKRGERWYVKWRDAAGVWQRKPTSATTKKAAQEFAALLEHKAERQRKGIEPMLEDLEGTFGALCTWWLENRCKPASRYNEEKRLGAHVLSQPIAQLPLAAVTSEALEEMLIAYEKSGAAPASFNKLRATLHSVFSKATRAKKWFGLNPIAAIETRKVPKKAYVTLRAEEVPVLLPWVPLEWRSMFATALYLALRKGELCGALKSDVDLGQRTFLVGRSYENDTTKGARSDVLPIADALVPYLEDALARTPGPYLFPKPDGSMRTEDCDPEKVLRTAMKNAGIVDGYDHTCRRCKAAGKPEAEHTTRRTDSVPGKCSSCGMALWVKPIPRTIDGAEMRFHDLRHSAATLLLRDRVEHHRVQRILRHANINTTLRTYGHLNPEDLRDAVNRIAPAAARATGTTDATPATTPAPRGAEVADTGLEAAARLGPTVVQTPALPPAVFAAPSEPASHSGGLRSGRRRFRTCDPCRVKPAGPVATGDDATLTERNDSNADSIGGDSLQRIEARSTPRGPTVVQPQLRVLDGGRGAIERLLSVRQVAELLGVSTATVYAMVDRAELAHVRVSSSIRFEASVVAALVAAGRRQ
jgi:integrase